MSVVFQKTIPILRIFDVAKAKEFYVGFLGFTVDWEHHFEDYTPAYLQVSRDGLVLHLSEHHGDACPGSTVFVWMTGIEEFHREITGKGYKYLRPGIETTFARSRGLLVVFTPTPCTALRPANVGSLGPGAMHGIVAVLDVMQSAHDVHGAPDAPDAREEADPPSIAAVGQGQL